MSSSPSKPSTQDEHGEDEADTGEGGLGGGGGGGGGNGRRIGNGDGAQSVVCDGSCGGYCAVSCGDSNDRRVGNGNGAQSVCVGGCGDTNGRRVANGDGARIVVCAGGCGDSNGRRVANGDGARSVCDGKCGGYCAGGCGNRSPTSSDIVNNNIPNQDSRRHDVENDRRSKTSRKKEERQPQCQGIGGDDQRESKKEKPDQNPHDVDEAGSVEGRRVGDSGCSGSCDGSGGRGQVDKADVVHGSVWDRSYCDCSVCSGRWVDDGARSVVCDGSCGGYCTGGCGDSSDLRVGNGDGARSVVCDGSCGGYCAGGCGDSSDLRVGNGDDAQSVICDGSCGGCCASGCVDRNDRRVGNGDGAQSDYCDRSYDGYCADGCGNRPLTSSDIVNNNILDQVSRRHDVKKGRRNKRSRKKGERQPQNQEKGRTDQRENKEISHRTPQWQKSNQNKKNSTRVSHSDQKSLQTHSLQHELVTENKAQHQQESPLVESQESHQTHPRQKLSRKRQKKSTKLQPVQLEFLHKHSKSEQRNRLRQPLRDKKEQKCQQPHNEEKQKCQQPQNEEEQMCQQPQSEEEQWCHCEICQHPQNEEEQMCQQPQSVEEQRCHCEICQQPQNDEEQMCQQSQNEEEQLCHCEVCQQPQNEEEQRCQQPQSEEEQRCQCETCQQPQNDEEKRCQQPQNEEEQRCQQSQNEEEQRYQCGTCQQPHNEEEQRCQQPHNEEEQRCQQPQNEEEQLCHCETCQQEQNEKEQRSNQALSRPSQDEEQQSFSDDPSQLPLNRARQVLEQLKARIYEEDRRQYLSPQQRRRTEQERNLGDEHLNQGLQGQQRERQRLDQAVRREMESRRRESNRDLNEREELQGNRQRLHRNRRNRPSANPDSFVDLNPSLFLNCVRSPEVLRPMLLEWTLLQFSDAQRMLGDMKQSLARNNASHDTRVRELKKMKEELCKRFEDELYRKLRLLRQESNRLRHEARRNDQLVPAFAEHQNGAMNLPVSIPRVHRRSHYGPSRCVYPPSASVNGCDVLGRHRQQPAVRMVERGNGVVEFLSLVANPYDRQPRTPNHHQPSRFHMPSFIRPPPGFYIQPSPHQPWYQRRGPQNQGRTFPNQDPTHRNRVHPQPRAHPQHPGNNPQHVQDNPPDAVDFPHEMQELYPVVVYEGNGYETAGVCQCCLDGYFPARVQTPDSSNAPIPHCCICLSVIINGAAVRELDCGHIMHKDCIDEWLRTHRTCPMCRRDVFHLYHQNLPSLQHDEDGDDESEGDDVDVFEGHGVG